MPSDFFTNARNSAAEHGGLIFLCFLMIFFSVFGQSIFFGVYLPMIREEIGLSKTYIGGLYAVATIAISLAIIYTGKKLDDLPLRYFVAGVLVMLALGCLTMSLAYSALVLFIAFFLLRHFGQGLMVLSATTSINRYMEKHRGKAVSIAGLGGALHMMIFPILALQLDEYLDWRTAWQLYALFTIGVLLPLFWWGLKSHQGGRHRAWQERIKAESEKAAETLSQSWTRREVLSHWRFYAIVAIMLVVPYLGTVIFFYQHELAASLQLSPLAFAASFPFFTLASIVAALGTGAIIDHFGEKPILIAFPILYAIGLLLLTAELHLFVVYIGMALIGAANGAMGTTGGPLLARLYGTEHLGGIKSLLFACNILATALSPFMFGLFMDWGIDILTLFFWGSFYSGVIWLLAFPICKEPAPATHD